MSAEPMNDLDDTLARVAADGLASGADRPVPNQEAALAHILDAMDACVLGRTLSVWINGQMAGTADIRGRKIARLCMADLADQPLNPGSQAQAVSYTHLTLPTTSRV